MTDQTTTTTALDKPDTLRTRLEAMAGEFKNALPAHIPVERFIRTVKTAVQLNERVAKAATESKGGMQSLLAACTKAAQDGLVLDGREAALVDFNVRVSKNPDKYEARVQYIPMVAGLMKKARNSGEISSLTAVVVFENDQFSYRRGDDERIDHAPVFAAARGKPIGVYAIARMKDGGIQREVMDRAQVMAIAAQSKNPKQYDPDEGKNFGEWWRKCVIRRISKYLPSSSDKADFHAAVERIDEDFDFDNVIDSDGAVTVEVPRAATKKRGGAAAALADVQDAEVVETKTEKSGSVKHRATTGEVVEDDDDRQPGDDI